MSDVAIMPQAVSLPLTPQPALQSTQVASRKPDDPTRIHEAAQQFEALLIGQMLRSVRESGGNWLNTGNDSSGDCATDFAEQQFATTMSKQGGLGLATLISTGLTRP
jgi:peptidoglycan hydrolase FlgJ